MTSCRVRSSGSWIDRLVTGPAAGDSVGMSVEPRGGSRRPTTDPILVIQLSASRRGYGRV
ncbi:MAG: hypothetical protein QOJ60_3231, partial [Actinomycetota bacterium]|nr:hypothetical protein [Actinomycetota bacterium]